MTPFYNIGIHAYRAAVAIASLRNVKARKLHRGQRDVEEYLRRKVASRPGNWVWIHAASLGEFEQGRPLIERLRRERPDLKILLTFFSPSGYEVRKDYSEVDAVCYLPFDTPRRVRRFLDLVKPTMAIFVKYEFWGNYLRELQRRGIDTYIISAIFRKGQIFFRPYGGGFRKLLNCYRRLYVQDEASRERLAAIGIENVTVAGDTRFDRVMDILKTTFAMTEVARFAENSRDVLVVGSSWPSDETFILPWLRRHPEVKAIIAPHEFDNKRLEALREALGGEKECRLLSELDEKNAAETRYIVVDSFGKLASLYRYGTVAYVGGGFGAGIHNLNEAAVYDLPVIYGPNHTKFKEALDLQAVGGGFPLTHGEDFDAIISRLTGDNRIDRTAAGRAAGDYIRRSIGATDKIFDDLFAKSENKQNQTKPNQLTPLPPT